MKCRYRLDVGMTLLCVITRCAAVRLNGRGRLLELLSNLMRRMVRSWLKRVLRLRCLVLCLLKRVRPR